MLNVIIKLGQILEKWGGGRSEAFIITDDNKVVPAHNYQVNALEKNIINDEVRGDHQFKLVEHSYKGNSITFSIIKQNTRLVDFASFNLSYPEEQSLYSFIRADGIKTFISQNKGALEKLIVK